MRRAAARGQARAKQANGTTVDGLKINEPWVVVTGVVIAIVALHWLFRDFQNSTSSDFLTYATDNFFTSPQWPLILAGLFSPFALLRYQSRRKSNYVDVAGYVVGIYCGGRFFLEALNVRAGDPDFAHFVAMLSLASAFAVGIAGSFAGLAHFVDRKRAEAEMTGRMDPPIGPDTVDSAGSSTDYFEFDPRIFLYGDDFLAGKCGREQDDYGGPHRTAAPGHEPGSDGPPRRRTDQSGRPVREPAKALPYYRRPIRYETDEALRMFDIAGIQDLPPSNTDGAISLASAYILSVGWIKAREFIHAAARDEDLPKRVRDFYIHALVVLDQLRREAELHNLDDLHAA